MKQNNRGQTLVLFVLLLPILLFVFGSIIDIGNLYQEKHRLEHTIDHTLNYGIEHLDTENLNAQLHDLLQSNLKKVDEVTILIGDHSITIAVQKKITRIFPFLFQKQEETISIRKSIYKIDDTLKIIKE